MGCTYHTHRASVWPPLLDGVSHSLTAQRFGVKSTWGAQWGGKKTDYMHIYIYISLGRNENNFYTVMRIITLNLTQPSSHVMLTSIEFPSIQRLQIRFVPECSTKIVVSDVSQFTSTRSSLSVWKERLKFCVSQNFLCGYSMYSACKSIHHRDSAWSETRPSRYCVNIVN